MAKASLYNTFGSKEELVRAYLKDRHASTAARIMKYIARYDTPRERILGVFEAQGELFAEPAFNGCAFVTASAEAHRGDVVDQAAGDYREWVRSMFAELAGELGAADPDTLARQLHLLYDGAGLSARMDRDPAVAVVSRAAAVALLDAVQP